MPSIEVSDLSDSFVEKFLKVQQYILCFTDGFDLVLVRFSSLSLDVLNGWFLSFCQMIVVDSPKENLKYYVCPDFSGTFILGISSKQKKFTKMYMCHKELVNIYEVIRLVFWNGVRVKFYRWRIKRS